MCAHNNHTHHNYKDEVELLHNPKVEESLGNDKSLQDHDHDGHKDEEPTGTPGQTTSALPVPVFIVKVTKIIKLFKPATVQVIQ